MTKPQSTAAYVLRLTLTLFLITVIVCLLYTSDAADEL